MPLPNRLAVYITGAIALLAGLAPLVGNLDWESTAGVIAGLIAVLSVVLVWLQNWGKWERGEGVGLMPGMADDVFDEDEAEPIPDQMVRHPEDPPPVDPKVVDPGAPGYSQPPPTGTTLRKPPPPPSAS